MSIRSQRTLGMRAGSFSFTDLLYMCEQFLRDSVLGSEINRFRNCPYAVK